MGLLVRAAALALALAAWGASPAEARLGLGEPLGDRGTRSHLPVPATPTAPLGVPPLRGGVRGAPSRVPARRSEGGSPLPERAARFVVRRPILSAWLGAFGGAMLLGPVLTGSGFIGFFGFFALLFVLMPIALFVTALRVARSMASAFAPGLISAAQRIWGPAPLLLGFGARDAHVGRADLEVFQRMLEGLQEAWSDADLPGLASGTTPELQSALTRQVEALSSRGEASRVQHLRLEQADLAEGWCEDGTDWATVTWRVSAVDWRERRMDGAVVDGSRTERSVATEAWTFVRLAAGPGRAGGPWRLSAVQPAA